MRVGTRSAVALKGTWFRKTSDDGAAHLASMQRADAVTPGLGRLQRAFPPECRK